MNLQELIYKLKRALNHFRATTKSGRRRGGIFRRKPPDYKINLWLFVATVFSTLIVGAFLYGKNPFQNPLYIFFGVPFSFTLLGILITHELGHFLMSKKHGVIATLPYFVPAPTLLGTFGAFIIMRSPIPHRRALLDIGVAGPLAGLAVAIPAVILGLSLSTIEPLASAGKAVEEGSLIFGESLLFHLLSLLVMGKIPQDAMLNLHPIAFAGWVGLLVTAFNLLPMSQLDGGHISYAILGRHHLIIARLTFAVLLICGFVWEGWFILAFFGIIMGLHHPPPVFDEIPLDARRRSIAILAFIIMILTFVILPIEIAQ